MLSNFLSIIISFDIYIRVRMVCHLSSNTHVASDTGCQWSNVVLCSYKAYNFLKILNFVVPILGLGGLKADIS